MIPSDDQLRWQGDSAVVSMPAEIDITNAGEVREKLSAAASLGSSLLVIDMSATTFCDSAGVQAIIDTYKLVETRNQSAATRTELRLAAAAVRRILTLTGIDQLIPVYPTLELALAGPVGQNAPSRDEPAG